MRTSMHISLPEPLKAWVETQIEEGGYGTASEYIRQLLREEQKRRLRQQIEQKLEAVLDSGPPVPVTDETWKETEREVMARIRARTKQRRSHAKTR